MLIEEIEKLRSEFADKGKELYDFIKTQAESLSNLERAAAFFVMNRISFSGVSYSGGFSQQSYLDRFTDSSIARVEKIKTVLNDVKITNTDYSEVLNHKSQFNDEDVIVYCDPPYESVNQKSLYGKTGSHHKNFDCEKFADDMRNCKFRWVISYDDSEKIRSLFSFANVVDFSMYYSMKKGKNATKIGNELLITNCR